MDQSPIGQIYKCLLHPLQLLQSIAVSEMILPVEPWGSLGDDELELDSTNLMELETSLNQLDVIEEFNPDEVIELFTSCVSNELQLPDIVRIRAEAQPT